MGPGASPTDSEGRALAPGGADGVDRRVGPALACAVAITYGWTAAPLGHALDAGELSAAGILLGIGHPPGQPLSSLAMRALAVLPLGPLSLRVALASSLAGAVATVLTFHAFGNLLQTVLCLTRAKRTALAAVGALLFALAPPVWQQAVRPEVYALQALVMAGLLERLSSLARPSPAVASCLAGAGLWVGLGAANHHLLTLLVLPGALLFGVAQLRRGRPMVSFAILLRWFAWCSAGGALGLATYAYLPLRASAAPEINLGQPDSWGRFLWVVSAQAFHGSALGTPSEPLMRRVADGVMALLEHGGVLCALAVGGGYLLMRRSGSRALGMFCLAMIVVPLSARIGLGAIAGNPDALGYLVPCYWALSLLVVVTAGVVLATAGAKVHGAQPSRPSRLLVPVMVGGLVSLVGWQAVRGLQVSLARAFIPFELEMARREALPPRAVVLLWTPQSAFLHWGGRAVDGARPDVLWLPVPLLRYPAMAGQLVAREPAVVDLVTALGARQLSRAAIERVRSRRPLLSELDVRVPGGLWRRLARLGLVYRMGAEPQAARSSGVGRARTRLQNAISDATLDEPSLELLLWHDLLASLYWLTDGRPEPAREHIRLLAQLMRLPADLDDLSRLADGPGARVAARRLRQRLSQGATRFSLVP